MNKVIKLGVQGNIPADGYVIRLETSQGAQQFLLSPSACAHLIEQIALCAQAAPSEDLKKAASPLTIESVSVGVLHGQTTLKADLQAGVQVVSTVDRSDLERLALEIQAALAIQPPPIQ